MENNQQLLGKLSTQPLDADAAGHETLTGIGQFETEVMIDMDMLRVANDKRGYTRHVLANALAHAVMSSTVPTHMWYFQLTPMAKELFNIPNDVISMDPMRSVN